MELLNMISALAELPTNKDMVARARTVVFLTDFFNKFLPSHHRVSNVTKTAGL
jgi:hypothetical protein